MKWTIEKKDEGKLLRDFLRNGQGFSRRILKSLIYDGGSILVNEKEVNVRYCLKSGDLVRIEFPEESKGINMSPENIPIDIIYEDEFVLVINKQAGIASIPALNHRNNTIANGILYYYQKNDIPYTVHVVTRLDRDTSGLLLIAKHRYSHSILSALQKQEKVKRKYYAIIEGMLQDRQGIIDANIGRKEGSIIERVVRTDGQRAITHYQVIKQTNLYSWLDVQLETGRTHQIRVHFSHVGHPLAGDDLYGGSNDIIPRQALHCYSIGFEHPQTKEWMTFTSELPEDMKKILSDE
ncbi:RluA family pseudouridine synthase [Paucisalibacillus sp. EB02]|uniref:RluA family pseudouridine synthase n=1 Tax=Paucisalibacillus sp. EB02 TaxID=1347087 RepID=UPI0005A879DB|nr:RluA family pseudouridine synthase [Paucisalibacillus sp. EB02]